MNVFITGASSGIGEVLVRHYATSGASVGLFARREAALARIARSLPSAALATYAGDVRDGQSLATAAVQFLSRFGTPDIVIANAGVSRGTLTDFAEDLPAFRDVF